MMDEEFDESQEEKSEIEALLDIGYEQLDGFARWLEEEQDFDARGVQRESFNAESLVDYLANHQRKAVADINEYELRWFLFSYYIRKAMADAETEERLFYSLRNFLAFLQKEYHYTPPAWLWATLEDQAFYHQRRRDYGALNSEDERAWEEGFREWCQELEDDLDTRSLLLPRDLGDGMQWGEERGWREATLWEEANRRWQEERAALLKDGLDFEQVQERLFTSYRLWVDTPQSRLDDKTPAEVILEERLPE